MRELEFRAWNKKRKKYYEVLHLHINDYEGNWATVKGFDIIEQKDIHIQIQPKDCIIEQYTGLRDKNGVKIFEGDIFMNGQSLRIIEFRNGNSHAITPSRKETILLSFIINNPKNTVIGNIHENEELLK